MFLLSSRRANGANVREELETLFVPTFSDLSPPGILEVPGIPTTQDNGSSALKKEDNQQI